MATELSTMVQTSVSMGPPETPIAASDQGLSDWAASNAYRLDGGDSVVWAGEQSGYAEAADADGMFLYGWSAVGDNRTCGDCEILSGFPPMPLADWPTSPGAGDTECNVGCRCSWDTWSAAIALGNDYSPSLSTQQSDLAISLVDRQMEALASMMSDAAYLD